MALIKTPYWYKIVRHIADGILFLLLTVLALRWMEIVILPDALSSWGIPLAFVLAMVLRAWAQYAHRPPGIHNNGVWHHPLTSRKWPAWMLSLLLTAFYVVLYFYPQYLGLGTDGAPNRGLIAMFDPLSKALSGNPASQWFVYGVLYTTAILGFGIKFLMKYRHNRYQIRRTLSVMFFQLGFAFLLPELLMALNMPYYNFATFWPLHYYYFDQWHVDQLLRAGLLGKWMFFWGLAMIFVISPYLTYRFGKRWFCSWVCGCGGLAETAGDPFRHLSDKSLRAWQIERYLIHSILVVAVAMTIGVVESYLRTGQYWLTPRTFVVLSLLIVALPAAWLLITQRDQLARDARILLAAVALLFTIVLVNHLLSPHGEIFFVDAGAVRKWYGFFIGSIFSGVIGVGFYPIMGSRVWCRFGCPLAAILGIQQKYFSRFRITVNGGQCISCGNCSVYCEMGIDVRDYAQRGKNIVRASCVGCGICAAVCPRGVLRLENGPSYKNKV